MTPDELRHEFERIPLEVFNTGNIDHADDLFTADYVEHVPLPPGIPQGLAGFKMFLTGLLTTFPDLKYTLGPSLAQGDMVAGLLMAEATHSGPFMTPNGPIPATGRKVRWTEMHMGRYKDGKLIEHWGEQDLLGMIAQITAPA